MLGYAMALRDHHGWSFDAALKRAIDGFEADWGHVRGFEGLWGRRSNTATPDGRCNALRHILEKATAEDVEWLEEVRQQYVGRAPYLEP